MSSSSSNPLSSNFKSILDVALSNYKKKTGNELLAHPLAAEVKRGDSVDAILATLQGQASAFNQSRAVDHSLMKWISPVVNILYAFSDKLGEVAGTVRPKNMMREECQLNGP